jgi:hypothetical protein
MNKLHKYPLVDEHYPMFKEFIWNMIPYATCEKEYTILDPRVLDWTEWFNQRGYCSLDGHCDPMNEVLPKYVAFF